jgi:hypothetical protein
MAQDITNWKADYTTADTNTPAEGVLPTVGPELREMKAVIRSETLNRFFRSDRINAFYLSGDDTFYIDDTYDHEWATDVDILPGETMLLTLDHAGDIGEFWAVVKTVTLAAGQVRLSVFTGVHLNGTDGTLTHIRRSVYKVPLHPSHNATPAYAETVRQVSSLNPRISTCMCDLRNTATTVRVAFPFKIPAAWNVRIFGTPRVIGATPATGAYHIKSITRDELEFTVTFNAAPGAGNIVNWLFTVYIE